MGIGDGGASPSPGQIGDEGPVPVPGQIGNGDGPGDGDRGVLALHGDSVPAEVTRAGDVASKLPRPRGRADTSRRQPGFAQRAAGATGG